MIPPIFIMCNPLQEPERYRVLQRQFTKCGLEFSSATIVHGKWGNQLTSKEVFEVWDPFQKHLGIDKGVNFKSSCLLKGEISLNRTFYEVVQKGLATNAESILVFESDVYLRTDFTQRLEEVLEQVKGRGWDYISLGEGVGTRPKGREMASYFSPTQVFDAPKHPWIFRCCDSMILHRKFLEKLAITFLPFRECLDWELNLQLHIHKGVALWVDPPLVEAGTGRHRTHSYLPC